jgi:hypothetical protein
MFSRELQCLPPIRQVYVNSDIDERRITIGTWRWTNRKMCPCTSATIVRMVRSERVRPIIVVNYKADFDPARLPPLWAFP